MPEKRENAMKDYCLELASKKTDFGAKLNVMREYLQAYILKIMRDEGLFRYAAFLGGTALRFLYGLPRFSEDLDFSLVKSGEYNFSSLMQRIKEELLLAGYDVSLTYSDDKNVHSAFVRFIGLMYEAGISPLKSQKFSIKVEIDTLPPKGEVLTTEIVNKYFPVAFLSYDLPSLLSGKLHALLSRKYTKGRDFFDLGWYLSRWKGISPNITLLHNALKQTGWKKELLDEKNWRDFIYDVVKKADWKKVTEDAQNFLENPSDMNIFSQGNMLKLIKGKI
ncbi:MAG: nucleotidyl transferase AbiEii/AbiGii toxin family protein [Candidatus Omnitrophota bacterium]